MCPLSVLGWERNLELEHWGLSFGGYKTFALHLGGSGEFLPLPEIVAVLPKIFLGAGCCEGSF